MSGANGEPVIGKKSAKPKKARVSRRRTIGGETPDGTLDIVLGNDDSDYDKSESAKISASRKIRVVTRGGVIRHESPAVSLIERFNRTQINTPLLPKGCVKFEQVSEWRSFFWIRQDPAVRWVEVKDAYCQSEGRFRISLPPVLFCVKVAKHTSGCEPTDMYAYICPDNLPGDGDFREVVGDVLPLPNIGIGGSVCCGYGEGFKSAAEAAEDAITRFWSSPFNYDMGSATPSFRLAEKWLSERKVNEAFRDAPNTNNASLSPLIVGVMKEWERRSQEDELFWMDGELKTKCSGHLSQLASYEERGFLTFCSQLEINDG